MFWLRPLTSSSSANIEVWLLYVPDRAFGKINGIQDRQVELPPDVFLCARCGNVILHVPVSH